MIIGSPVPGHDLRAFTLAALRHAAAALFHHHVVKDGVLRRMWRPAAGTLFHRKGSGGRIVS